MVSLKAQHGTDNPVTMQTGRQTDGRTDIKPDNGSAVPLIFPFVYYYSN